MKFELFISLKPAATHDGLSHGITQDARFTKYADYTTIDGARRCCRLPRYVDLVRSQQLSWTSAETRVTKISAKEIILQHTLKIHAKVKINYKLLSLYS